MAESTVARVFVVRGRVQGVGFRYFTLRAAEEVGVSGWVRNLDDGSVEAFAQGTAVQVRDFESQLWKGPRFSEVRGVESKAAGLEAGRGFRIRQ